MFIGTATSGHQVEGNNKNSDWWRFEQTGELRYKSGSGCAQYRLYKKDIEIMKRLHLNAYRFSIEFSRVMPSPGVISTAAIDHYRDLIKDLKSAGIEPIPTLWHYTLPLWFYRLGGFTNRVNFKYFIKYIDALLERGLDVDYVLTMNEPVIYAGNAFLTGRYPPFKNSIPMFFSVLENILNLHNEAYDTLKAFGYKVSFSNHFIKFNANPVLYPLLYYLHSLFNRRPLARTRFDFIGVNYYKSVSAERFILSRLFPSSKRIWLSSPEGLKQVVEDVYRRFRKPVLVTENGVDTLDDKFREKLIKESFASLMSARRDGVRVLGYLHWSFIDNFEWDYGYTRNYGIISFDQRTKKRTLKGSASVLSKIAEKYA
jgi:beta-glucosidase